MMERRVVTRYNLQVPAQVEIVPDSGEIKTFEWKTRNVSSSGAFLLTGGELLDTGTNLKVNLFLNSFSGAGSWVSMNGKVVRSESEGVGVCFDGQYQFVSEAPDLNM
ncbi:MAG: PilZ domain-containing protein [Deltaproteobacteria bacterium]|nr:PilZ domain-containing protein [Deltaproteobacteria bacterium]